MGQIYTQRLLCDDMRDGDLKYFEQDIAIQCTNQINLKDLEFIIMGKNGGGGLFEAYDQRKRGKEVKAEIKTLIKN
jgi:hypothetical protein